MTGDGNIDAVIMVKMVNLLPINGYQFNYNLEPDIVDVFAVYDGTSIQFSICMEHALDMGMSQEFAVLSCESSGYSNGLQAQMSTPDNNGVVLGELPSYYMLEFLTLV